MHRDAVARDGHEVVERGLPVGGGVAVPCGVGISNGTGELDEDVNGDVAGADVVGGPHRDGDRADVGRARGPATFSGDGIEGEADGDTDRGIADRSVCCSVFGEVHDEFLSGHQSGPAIVIGDGPTDAGQAGAGDEGKARRVGEAAVVELVEGVDIKGVGSAGNEARERDGQGFRIGFIGHPVAAVAAAVAVAGRGNDGVAGGPVGPRTNRGGPDGGGVEIGQSGHLGVGNGAGEIAVELEGDVGGGGGIGGADHHRTGARVVRGGHPGELAGGRVEGHPRGRGEERKGGGGVAAVKDLRSPGGAGEGGSGGDLCGELRGIGIHGEVHGEVDTAAGVGGANHQGVDADIGGGGDPACQARLRVEGQCRRAGEDGKGRGGVGVDVELQLQGEVGGEGGGPGVAEEDGRGEGLEGDQRGVWRDVPVGVKGADGIGVGGQRSETGDGGGGPGDVPLDEGIAAFAAAPSATVLAVNAVMVHANGIGGAAPGQFHVIRTHLNHLHRGGGGGREGVVDHGDVEGLVGGVHPIGSAHGHRLAAHLSGSRLPGDQAAGRIDAHARRSGDERVGGGRISHCAGVIGVGTIQRSIGDGRGVEDRGGLGEVQLLGLEDRGGGEAGGIEASRDEDCSGGGDHGGMATASGGQGIG